MGGDKTQCSCFLGARPSDRAALGGERAVGLQGWWRQMPLVSPAVTPRHALGLGGSGVRRGTQ